MNQIVALWKWLQLGRTVALMFVVAALFLTTACNPGNAQGARPHNPPVQMGGNNNPHTMGGDGYTNYRMSTDPSVNNHPENQRSKTQPKRASLLQFDRLVAARSVDSNASDLLYPGTGATDTNQPGIGPKDSAFRPEPMPAPRQRVIDRSNPNEKILEKIGQQFEDATEFLKDDASSNANRAEQ